MKIQFYHFEKYISWEKVTCCPGLLDRLRSNVLIVNHVTIANMKSRQIHVYVLDPSCLLPVRPAANLYRTSPLKPRTTVGSDSQPKPLSWPLARQSVSNSCVLSAKQSSRTSNFNVFCLKRPVIGPPTSLMSGERATPTLPGCGLQIKKKERKGTEEREK